MVRSRPVRRRQRSVRVSVSVTCMALATLSVLAALPARSYLWLGLGTVVAMAFAWASLRILWTEVLQTRRDSTAANAATAAAYQTLFEQRAAEHAEFTEAMTARLAAARLTLHETEGELVAAIDRATTAERGRRESDRRLVGVQARAEDLERELSAAREVLAASALDDDSALASLISFEHARSGAQSAAAARTAG